jgi:hypothetical protein
MMTENQFENQTGEGAPIKINNSDFFYSVFNLLGSSYNNTTKNILIEGFDKEGKTTLAKTFSRFTTLGYVHYPLQQNGYQDAKGYVEEMENTINQLEGKVIDRFVYSTIAYQDFRDEIGLVAYLMNFVKENCILIMSTSFKKLIDYKLKGYRELKEILDHTRMILLHPYLLYQPDFKETLVHMNSKESMLFIINHFMNKVDFP